MNDIERETYLLRAKVDRLYQLRKEEALCLLKQFSELVIRPYLSMSWGKDSIVAYSLVRRVFPDIRVVYVNCGEFDEWPDTLRVKTLMCDRFGIDLVEVQAESVVQCFRRVGYWYPPPAKTDQEHASDTLYSDSFLNAIDLVTGDCDGNIMGLRAEESAGRASLFTYRGPIYYRHGNGNAGAKCGRYVCCPLHDWTTDNIWTYHAEFDLPYNELYDCPGVEPRRRRNGAMFGGTGAERGGLQTAKRLYPDLFNHFAAEFPAVRCYT